MPIYEYKCKNCGAQIEKLQGVSDAPLTVCETCGGELEKQLSLSAFQFKGDGWYVTDYSKKGGSAAVADKPEKEAKPTSDSTEKTEPASKVKEPTPEKKKD
ncbi:MAG: FmdB family zinc ribbon protein [Pyrinomonadaceae bacterium]